MINRYFSSFFIFFFLFFVLIFPCFADENLDSMQKVDEIFDLVDQALSSSSSEFPDQLDDHSLQSEVDLSESSPSPVNNNLLIIERPDYSMSDIAAAFYEALAQAEAGHFDELSDVTDISIMPLYTPDTGTTSIPTGSLRYVLTQVIGPYSPVVVQYQYNNGSNTAYLREIYPDYVWMISAALFALMIYCVFRLWGAILCKR